jgi:pyruvate,orthophosphate dikinase
MTGPATQATQAESSGRRGPQAEQRIYSFGDGRAEGRGDWKDLLGGKGAGLAEMTNAGVPVPPGFTITTEVCRYYYAHGRTLPADFPAGQDAALTRLEDAMGKRLGDPVDPLLVSVRSGAKFSMPGMMDTILNLGLNDRSVEGLARRSANERFAWDCYRRFLQMYGNVVLGVSKEHFEARIAAHKKRVRARQDTELGADDWKQLVTEFKALVRKHTGREFPQEPRAQLDGARDAVFRSWSNDRAVFYRRQHGIPDDLGTAVTVQAMVFGNLGETSGTGVGFTRNPATGAREFYGEFLVNAQGEDVVAGIRTPQPLAALKKFMPKVYQELHQITHMLEEHYRDVQDFEFTVQEGRLFLLQTRTAKRTAAAAVKIAVDMTKEKRIRKEEAILRVEPDALNQLLHPQVDPKVSLPRLARGLPASPGAAVGKIVFTADEAVERSEAGEPVLLVRSETVPDDIHGMVAARGILTSTGGMTSHAAVVARGMGRCCVVGASDLHIDAARGVLVAGDRTIRRGETLTLDGNTGAVYLGQAPLVDPHFTAEFEEFMTWADELRRLGVRANADVPADAERARAFGAQGIGLCRTEHMFFAEERLPIVVEMILAAGEYKSLERQEQAVRAEIEREDGKRVPARRGKDLADLTRRRKEREARYRGAIARLLPFQRRDFLGIFRAMDGLPVTIRTLDPPLHEFLPKREELMAEVARREAEIACLEERRRRVPPSHKSRLEKRKELLRRVEELHEFNPMLGHRGCRLGITYPEVTQMQVRAILEAALQAAEKGVRALPEIMIPLVGHLREFESQERLVREVAEEVFARKGKRVTYLVGTMIEVPRAALTAGEIATRAEFFSFGTNDLTQMTYGFSRDDTGRFLPYYVEQGILPGDPFVSLDEAGVGRLVETATREGRAARGDLKVGICGEHGGDPASVEFCHRTGLDYVSASPYRVPIARLAAAQAAVRDRATASDSR